MMLDYVLEDVFEGDSPESEARTIRALGMLRKEYMYFPERAGQERSLRWTDIFGQPREQRAGLKMCNLCDAYSN